MALELSIILIGLVGGLSMGLTGVGAGTVINSLLLLFVPSLGMISIVGTSAVEGTLLKLLVSWKEYIRSSDYRNQVGWMILGAIPATIVGSSLLLHWLSNLPLFRIILYYVLALASIIILIEALIFRTQRHEIEKPEPQARSKWLLMGWGILLGLIVGATSIGTGSLMVTTLLLVLRFPIKRAVALALWSGGIILMAASVTHILQGHVDWHLLLNLMIGSIPGILLGQYLRLYLPSTPLRVSVAILIFYLMSRNLFH